MYLTLILMHGRCCSWLKLPQCVHKNLNIQLYILFVMHDELVVDIPVRVYNRIPCFSFLSFSSQFPGGSEV